MSVERMCALSKLSRAGYYRFRTTPESGAADIDLRDAIQRVALEFPSYGRPRITKELGRRGWRVGHNRVYRIMREDSLLCLRRRKFVVTTNSRHDRPIYPNLARDLVVTGVNQLWVADITYIRLEAEFVYLAVVLDACSRRVIGWALGPHTGRRSGDQRPANGAAAPITGSGSGAPLRPRCPVRIA